MTDETDQSDNGGMTSVQRRPRLQMWRVRISLALLLALLGLAALAWVERKSIADNVIADELEKLGLPATYTVERIGGSRQVLTNIVIGDPERPDMTIERARVTLEWGMFEPRIDLISLTEPRLYGSYRDGQLSFGSLDPLLFDSESEEAAGLPDIDIELIDGRALLDSDYGEVGFKAEGNGNLASGFAGTLAANAPSLDVEGCAARRVTLYADVTTSGGKASFDGPVRLASLSCPSSGLNVANVAAALDGTLDEDFAGFDAAVGLEGEKIALSGMSLAGIDGTSQISWRDAALTASYDLSSQEVLAAGASIAALSADGDFRSRDSFATWEAQSEITGARVQVGSGFDTLLLGDGGAIEGTLFEPILAKVQNALQSEGRGSRLAADVTVRGTGEVLTAVVPQATLRGTSGSVLLALSRFQLSTAGSGAPRFSGNFSTGGRDLPKIAGRMERQPSGNSALRVNMAQYRAGDASLALPELLVSQSANGDIGFTGQATASGPLTGGATRNLTLPISGSYSAGGELSMWRSCTDIRFDQLSYANLTLERRGLTLCPAAGKPILSAGSGGLRIAAGAPSLDVAGSLGETPITLASGPIGFAYPGVMAAKNVAITLGPEGTATRFSLTDLNANLGDDEISGTFSGTDAFLDAIPLDILGASGAWSYAGGVLALAEGTFELQDREVEDRFQPLTARGATLALEDNLITARAILRNPESDRVVSEVDIRHSLNSGTGYADLTVPDLVFDDQLTAAQVTGLALGVVAEVYGTVTGTGRIDWNAEAVTSTGRFSSNDIDFAAAFGPVKDVSGTIVFSDLLAMTTAPGQKIRVGSFNPGIEVFDGEIEYTLTNGELLAVQSGSWPFMGGTLTLQPADINVGFGETRRFTMVIDGLEAAQFVEQMELGNLTATGMFDGQMPLIFDENGGRIEGGTLVSRTPGGNISYVGELTYEDMNPFANFAFDALRSLDFKEMRIAMDGSLTGDLVTRVRFDGVKQGEGAKRNFVTRRLAKLPLRFNINIRAPFYKLITSIKAMYDPAFIRDPQDLGLVESDGTVLQRAISGDDVEPAAGPLDIIPDEAPIQTPESENQP
ncbi:YdbH domain-containing protein [Altererythrobacter sp. ZODW24]|uniref:YdbH domain-containing protein n=1 Tax=Altererythrobacter sp. ZODW24 TaxID=2185142 RepID=UPI001F0786CE|nr:YdbH domain-containing protein [Altererythrobacter sp. ZODW24]